MQLSLFIRSVLRPFKVFIARFLIKTKVLDKFVLIQPDGGICSQMHFYMIGRFFEKKGYKVKYTLEWFNKNGHDMNGVDVRNFDLLKAFPDIHIETAGSCESFYYGVFSYINDYFDKTSPDDWQQLNPPIFLKGYYNTPRDWYREFKSVFKVDYNVLDEQNKLLLNCIKETENPVAVHVRRGDLAVFNPAYGEPASVSYFKKAMLHIEKNKSKVFYYFFSDDPEWVVMHLIPGLDLGKNYKVVDLNAADKGYYDLLLISACKNHITSKGSLGKYGGFLCNESDNIITVKDDEYERNVWEGADHRIVFIQ